jgi:hypothetical protein
VQAHRGGRGIAPTIHSQALAGGGRSAWCSGSIFTLKTQHPLYSGLGRPWGQCGQYMKSHPHWNSITRPSSLYSHYTDWAIPAASFTKKGLLSVACMHKCEGEGLEVHQHQRVYTPVQNKIIQQTKSNCLITQNAMWELSCCWSTQCYKWNTATEDRPWCVCHHSLYNGTHCYLYTTFPQLVLKTD